jgi:hypothetical protein
MEFASKKGHGCPSYYELEAGTRYSVISAKRKPMLP